MSRRKSSSKCPVCGRRVAVKYQRHIQDLDTEEVFHLKCFKKAHGNPENYIKSDPNVAALVAKVGMKAAKPLIKGGIKAAKPLIKKYGKKAMKVGLEVAEEELDDENPYPEPRAGGKTGWEDPGDRVYFQSFVRSRSGSTKAQVWKDIRHDLRLQEYLGNFLKGELDALWGSPRLGHTVANPYGWAVIDLEKGEQVAGPFEDEQSGWDWIIEHRGTPDIYSVDPIEGMYNPTADEMMKEELEGADMYMAKSQKHEGSPVGKVFRHMGEDEIRHFKQLKHLKETGQIENPRKPLVRGRFEIRPTGKYIREKLEETSKFDVDSFRTKAIGRRGHNIIIGCPIGKYDKRKKKCKVGTRTQSILHPLSEAQMYGFPAEELEEAGIPITAPREVVIAAENPDVYYAQANPVSAEDVGAGADVAAEVAGAALTGATIGSVVPGVGTAVGAGVGAGVAAAREAYKRRGKIKKAIKKKLGRENPDGTHTKTGFATPEEARQWGNEHDVMYIDTYYDQVSRSYALKYKELPQRENPRPSRPIKGNPPDMMVTARDLMYE